jgi:VWFA-related protein
MVEPIASRPANLAPMRLRSIASLFLALIAFPVVAQTAANPAPAAPTPTLPAGTPIVVVDVAVQDKSGQSIHGLKKGDFQVSENGAPQTIYYFQEHTPNTPISFASPAVNLAEGEFTDITPVKPGETLTVLLLDALNTPTKDQAFMRQQLLKYVQTATPGTHLAIFGLTTHLTMLQSFTADPEILKNAVDHKLIPRASALLDDSATGAAKETSADKAKTSAEAASMAMVAANLSDFETQSATEPGLRSQYTLDAFNTLAHYLASFLGRKNVIWFSESFPFHVLPSSDAKNPLPTDTDKSDLFQQTSALLSRNQVAIYPVDARALMATPTVGLTDQQAAMKQIADDTGGQVIPSTGGIADAVRKAIEAGSNYYTFSYPPTNQQQDGTVRNIQVALNGNIQSTLTFRRGYFANKPAPAPALPPPPATKNATDANKSVAPARTPEQEAAEHIVNAYANAVMARGGPTPQDIPFKVRVLPASKETEPAIAPGNEFGSYKLPGPYQRFDLDFLAVPGAFSYKQESDGSHRGAIEFIAYVYTTDGRLINASDHPVSLRVPADKVADFLKQPVRFRIQVSSPAKTETYLRIGVRDMITNHFGVIELPVSVVSTLPPPVDAEGSAPANATPAKPPVTPGTAPAAPPH